MLSRSSLALLVDVVRILCPRLSSRTVEAIEARSEDWSSLEGAAGSLWTEISVFLRRKAPWPKKVESLRPKPGLGLSWGDRGKCGDDGEDKALFCGGRDSMVGDNTWSGQRLWHITLTSYVDRLNRFLVGSSLGDDTIALLIPSKQTSSIIPRDPARKEMSRARLRRWKGLAARRPWILEDMTRWYTVPTRRDMSQWQCGDKSRYLTA